MSKHDPAMAVFALLQLLADAPAAKARLEVLVKAKAEADAAIKEQQVMAAAQSAAQIRLDGAFNELRQQEQSLNRREKALADAQNEHQESITRTLTNRQKYLEDFNRQVADKNAELNAKENELTNRLKAVAGRETAVEIAMVRLKQSNELLSHREVTLSQRQAEHADKVAKLKELTQ